jgi:hypothetical protein
MGTITYRKTRKKYVAKLEGRVDTVFRKYTTTARAASESR